MTNEITESKENKFTEFLKKLGKRNIIIICAVVLISAAVILNWVLFANAEDGDGNYGDYTNGGANLETGGSSNAGADADSGNSSGTNNTDSFFSSTQISRERARDEAMEVLQSVIDNASADEATKAAAIADMTKLAKDMESEANIETLIVAKGFEKCVAVINDDAASIVVKADGTLTPAQLAQINEIVYMQTGIVPANINIIQK